MAKKSLGYVHLEWTCPFCNTRNPGTNEKCSSCGAPQPTDVEFEQAAEEELVQDEALIAEAKAGPDIHCPFCGTRNPGTATACSQCGGDLTDAAARDAGTVLGAHKDDAAPDVACPFCGTMNRATAYKCSQCGGNLQQPEPEPETAVASRPTRKRSGNRRLIGIIALVVVLGICGLFVALILPTDDVVGTVQGVEWTRTMVVEGLGPVDYEDWRADIPADAEIGSCSMEPHHVQDNPAPGAEEICGTPYTVDTGTGLGEVVQDCRYQVYEEFCDYTVMEWQPVDEVTTTGTDFNPYWPDPALSTDQRLGESEETYRIIFNSDGERYTYATGDAERFTEFTIGSDWVLQLNTFGGVVSVEPN